MNLEDYYKKRNELLKSCITKQIYTHLKDIIVFLIIGILTFIFLLKSPLHPWIGSEVFTDSSVFKTIALMMEQGYMPYKDSFDHKGPLLYIINWLGNRISSYRGVWVLEFIFMTCNFFVIYKIARLSCKKGSAFIVMLISSSLLWQYYEGGNLVEEYAMVFIAMAIFIFIDYFKNNKISRARVIISGLCLGCTLLLRPNMIAVWGIFCIAILVELLYKGEKTKLKSYIIWFTLGWAMVVVPIFIWLILNNAFSQFWEDYIVFNELYISKDSGTAIFTNKWNAFFFFCNTPVHLIAFCSIVYHCSNRVMLNYEYLLYMIATLLLICLSGKTYGHYGMILIPAFSYPLSLIFQDIENIENKNVSQSLLLIVCVYVLNANILPNWMDMVKAMVPIYINRGQNHISDEVKTIVNIIDNNTDADDVISVYGNWNIIYVLSNRKHATRYSYQFPIGKVMPGIMAEYIIQMQQELPQIVVIDTNYQDDNIMDFLHSYQYDLVYPEKVDDIKRGLVYMKGLE